MDSEARVERVLAEWRFAREQGVAASPEQVIRQHPELAEDLEEAFAFLEALDDVLAGDDAAPPRVPDVLGPFRILREIGSGGMGTVCLAKVEEAAPGLESGQHVALKIIHPHLLGRAGFFQRFLREAQAGRQVRHESVVRTLGAASVRACGETIHFMVMEYVEGRTLREMGTVPEALLREIALQAASGLAAIHDAGIVHRDLKPENLLITDDHRVRIMDLGVARLIGESVALTREGQFAGTLHYAAPEQFRKGEIGPAADLYALGVLLYELATGVNPFRGDQAAAVMRAHLEHVPPRANERSLEVSPFLSEVLATLLEKNSSERFASAEQLREVLACGESVRWWADRERTILAAATRVPLVPVRRETALYGRETDLDLLRRCWEKARGGEGTVLLVEGEAGIGKSRLVDAFLRGLRDGDAHLLYGSYSPAGGMGGLSDAILNCFGASELEVALRPYVASAPGLVSVLCAFLRRQTPTEGGERADGEVLHAAAVKLMRGLAEESPVLWVVEDLHFAKQESRDIVLSLARAVVGHRVLLLLTTRPDIPADDLARVGGLDGCRTARLRRLGARDVVLMLKEAFRSAALAEKLGGKIALKSDGVPFFVFEMIRGLREGQFITQLPDGSYVESKVIEEIEVPSAVRDLMEVRLKGLSDEERAILDVGSVLGYEFDPDTLAQVRGVVRVQILERLAAVERRSAVVRADGSGYRFDHHQIQEAIYTGLPDALRAEYHTLIADALAGQAGSGVGGQAPDEKAYLYVHHALKGNRKAAALPLLDAVLTHLDQSFRSEAAVQIAESALQAKGLLTPAGTARVLIRKAGQLHVLGRSDEESLSLEQALSLATEAGDGSLIVDAQCSRGRQLIEVARYDEARVLLHRALQTTREQGNVQREAEARSALGSAAFITGRYEDACTHLRTGIDLYREAGDRRGEIVCGADLSDVLRTVGEVRGARELLEHYLGVARGAGDLIGERRIVQGMAMLFSSTGLMGEAGPVLERSLALARETGDRRGEASAVNDFGLSLFFFGRYAEAREHFELFLGIARDVGDRHGAAIAEKNLGTSSRYLGEAGRARAHFERFLSLSREIGYRDGEAGALRDLANLEADAGEHEHAEELYRQSLSMTRELGLSVGTASILAALGGLLIREEREEEAGVLLEEAVSIARKVGSPEWSVLCMARGGRLLGRAESAAELLERVEERLGVRRRMEARLRLWEATGRAEHLRAAHRLLLDVIDRNPGAAEEVLVDRVSLHRDIMAAWEEHGAAGA